MAILAKDNRKDFLPAPEGLHQAVCVDVVDLGLQETPWGAKEKVEVRWQLEVINPETDKPFLAVKRYTLSLNEKATLRHHLEAWRGKKFTTDELSGFDLEKLLGANAQVQIVHNVTDEGRTYSNVQAVVPLGKGMVKMGMQEYTRMKDRPGQQGAGTPGEADDDNIPF
jgi:hypothetical protein